MSDLYLKEFYDNGQLIDLAGLPLHYGDKANMLTKVKKTLENLELKYYNSPIEYGRLVNSKGKIIQDAVGDAKSVRTLTSNWKKSYAYTHIHPREKGILGGTLSEQDIIVFCQYSNVKIMRAAAKEGIYSMIKLSNFNGSGLKEYYHEEIKNWTHVTTVNMCEILNKYIKSKITYDEYSQEYNKETNRFLVGLHNILFMGQFKFNYSYTLERR